MFEKRKRYILENCFNLYQQFSNIYGILFCVDLQVMKYATFYQNLVMLIPPETLTKTLQEITSRIPPEILPWILPLFSQEYLQLFFQGYLKIFFRGFL